MPSAASLHTGRTKPGRRGCCPSRPTAAGALPNLLSCPHKLPSESQPLATPASSPPPAPVPAALPACLLSPHVTLCVLSSKCLASSALCGISTFYCLACSLLKCACCPSCALIVNWDFGLCLFCSFSVLGHLANATPQAFIPN